MPIAIIPDTRPAATQATTAQDLATARTLRSAAGTIAARGHQRDNDEKQTAGVTVLGAVRESAQSLHPTQWVRVAVDVMRTLAAHLNLDVYAHGTATRAVADWEDQTPVTEIVAALRSAADTLTAGKVFEVAA